MKPQPPKPNPFETIWTRRKFDIIGKKRKGEERRIGLARSLAVEKRKKTLLKEDEQSGKASVFVDRRIGEKDDALGEFDKGILRSQGERQGCFCRITWILKSLFHCGCGSVCPSMMCNGKYINSLFKCIYLCCRLNSRRVACITCQLEKMKSLAFMETDDFHEELEHGDSDGDQSDDGKRSHILKQLGALSSDKFLANGSTEGEENRHRSSKEIYKEIMLKNKLYKAQKAEVKEENEMLTEQLDKDFESLMQAESLLSHTRPGKLIALLALVNKNIPKEIMEKDQTSVSGKSSLSKKEELDSYDKLYSEMLLEARARGVLNTIPRAEKEHEKQEVVEKDRQRRKLPTDGGEEDDASEDHQAASAQRSRPVSEGDEDDSDGTDEENDENAGNFEDWEQDDDDLGADVEQAYDLLELKAPKPLLYKKEEVHEICALEFLDVVSLPEDSAFFSSDNFRASVLVSAVEVLPEFVELYGELRAFPEIFLPISKITVDELHKLRQPLQMWKQKPVPIKLLNPKFEENFVKGRDYDPDRELKQEG
ncbi:Nucleolar protein 14-like protein [Drosera capensis]